MVPCEFAKFCGGRHTTAQHHLHVYERVITAECGFDCYFALKSAVDRDANRPENGQKRQIAVEGTPLADQYDAEAEEDIRQGRLFTLQELVDYDKEIGI